MIQKNIIQQAASLLFMFFLSLNCCAQIVSINQNSAEEDGNFNACGMVSRVELESSPYGGMLICLEGERATISGVSCYGIGARANNYAQISQLVNTSLLTKQPLEISLGFLSIAKVSIVKNC